MVASAAWAGKQLVAAAAPWMELAWAEEPWARWPWRSWYERSCKTFARPDEVCPEGRIRGSCKEKKITIRISVCFNLLSALPSPIRPAKHLLGTDFWTTRDTDKVPSVQFSSKAAVLGFSGKESRHDFLGKDLAVANDKCLSVGQPANGVVVLFVGENVHQSLRENVLAVFVKHFFRTGVIVRRRGGDIQLDGLAALRAGGILNEKARAAHGADPVAREYFYKQ